MEEDGFIGSFGCDTKFPWLEQLFFCDKKKPPHELYFAINSDSILTKECKPICIFLTQKNQLISNKS